MKRYALYAVPPARHPLWSEACAWLGRDAETGAEGHEPGPAWLSPARRCHITAEPRRYGFHGTLKPPFALAPGKTAADLTAALERFAGLPPVDLRVAALSGFLALVPRDPAPTLHALADRCVAEFDVFRAAPSAAELARRRGAGLSLAQDAHLERWGYPYVFDQFRFHMTLTGRLDEPERSRLADWLGESLAPCLARPVPLELALFEQSGDGPFRLVRRWPAPG